MPIVTLRLNEQDLAAAARLHKDRLRGHGTYFEVPIILFFVWFFLGLPGYSEILALLVAVFGAVVGLAISVLNGWWFQNRKRVAEPQEVAWGESGLTITNQAGASSLRWIDFRYWTEGDGTILLYRTRSVFLILPARAFVDPGDVRQLREALVDAGVRRIGARLPRFKAGRAEDVF